MPIVKGNLGRRGVRRTHRAGVWSSVALGYVAVTFFHAGLPFVWGFFIPGSLLNALANWLRFRRGDWRETSLAGEAA